MSAEPSEQVLQRRLVLCRTCMRPLTWETRTEPGFLPREGWYDDARSDPLVCFKAADYNHVPLTDREWAYYEAGHDEAEAQIHDLLEEREELLTEIRRLRMGNHPAGRALRVPDCPDHLAAATALREALTERDAEHEGGGA